MDIELIEIRDFLAAHPPFDRLDEPTVNRLLRHISIRYLRRGMPFPPESNGSFLYLVRQGAIELRDSYDQLLDLLNEGELYFEKCSDGASSLISKATTREDTLLYQIPCGIVDELRNANHSFDRFFSRSLSERLHQALHALQEHTAPTLTTVHCAELISRPPVSASPEISIQEAARLMSEQGVSALLVKVNDTIDGIVTDRDLRMRCIAAGVSNDSPLGTIMSTPLKTVAADSSAYEALLLMSQLGIHHLPIAENGRVIGMLTSTDLFRHQSTNAIHLVAAIRRGSSVETLIELSAQLHELQRQLSDSGASGRDIGKAVTTVIDALTVKLLQLAEAKLGPPPVPYTWLVFGSQARGEQTAHTDQDNGLLLDDSYTSEHAPYFEALAEFVNTALGRCGITLCAGEVMARTPKWRQPLSKWKSYFSDWVMQPDPMALMHLSIFFDLRALHGATELADRLRAHLLSLTHDNSLFLAYLTANALHHRPPLGFFRQLVLIREGEHADTIDLKQHGIIPIVDLARIQALAAGHLELNSHERLRAMAADGILSEEANNNLLDVLDLLLTLRARHQAEQISNGQAPDNFLSPQQLSDLERRHLKDAFGVIGSLQRTLAQRYQSERFA